MNQALGRPQEDTFLIFGFYGDVLPHCLNHSAGLDARERFHLPYLMQEIIGARGDNPPPDPGNLFAQLAGLIRALGADTLYEVNSQLFCGIDLLAHHGGRDLTDRLSFIGIELHPLFRDVTRLLHPQTRIALHTLWCDAPPPGPRSVCRNRWSASLFKSTAEQAGWLAGFGAAQSSLWFAPDNSETTFDFMGIPHLLMAFEPFCAVLAAADQTVNVNQVRKINFYGTPLVEAVITSYRHDLLADASPLLESGPMQLGGNSPRFLDDIPPHAWLPPAHYDDLRTNRLDSFCGSNAVGQVSLATPRR